LNESPPFFISVATIEPNPAFFPITFHKVVTVLFAAAGCAVMRRLQLNAP
jgi:hypothetical protein